MSPFKKATIECQTERQIEKWWQG